MCTRHHNASTNKIILLCVLDIHKVDGSSSIHPVVPHTVAKLDNGYNLFHIGY